MLESQPIVEEQTELSRNQDTPNIAVAMSSADELKKWEYHGLEKEEVEKLETNEFASCLAAFLMRYSNQRLPSYEKLRDALQRKFEEYLITGYIFKQTDEEEKNTFVEAVMEAISSVESEMTAKILRGSLEDFMSELIDGKQSSHRVPEGEGVSMSTPSSFFLRILGD